MSRGEVYDQLLDWLPTWALTQIAQALRDAHDMGYADVRVEVRDGKAMYIWVGQGRQIRNPTKE